jgi:hypothetical protein
MASDASRCGVSRCDRAAAYRFVSGKLDADARCHWHALTYRPVCGRAIMVALIVGTILMVINQADVILGGHMTPLVAGKIALTYLVPFSVSTYSALAANRLGGKEPKQRGGG